VTHADRRLRVMLVDDHALVRAAVRQALMAPDIEIVGECATGEEALVLAPELRPDIVLLDVDMPGMSGVHVVRELAPRLPGTKIIMLTVSDRDRDILEAMRSGATGYMTKDVGPEALQRAVRGAAAGDLAMPRRLAARVVAEFSASARRAPTASEGDGLAALSPREIEVLRSLRDGLTDREIAGALGLSTRTVETHVANILRKLDVRNRAEAARRADHL
jgi:DNA-binding NarL/FixJ family response regulator